jgi:hypothetical protein
MQRRLVPWIAILPLLAAIAHAALPRAADLRRFDAAAMAEGETRMWRHYYEHRYLALFADLYRVARCQFGFSPLDSARIAVAAAAAARRFQPTTSRADAQAALPELAAYYRLLARAAPGPVDTAAAARTELDWWQARRESSPPERYGLTIARVSTLLYGVDGEAIRAAGLARAEAMAYRDAQGHAMTDADWTAIARRLAAAYALLKAGVDGPSPANDR